MAWIPTGQITFMMVNFNFYCACDSKQTEEEKKQQQQKQNKKEISTHTFRLMQFFVAKQSFDGT